MMKFIGFILCCCVLFSTSLQAQSVWERLEAWERSINDAKASIDVDVLMLDENNLEHVLDKSEIQIIQDEDGYYAKLFDFEFFVEGEVGFSVDHLDKKIKFTSVETIKGVADEMLRMTALASMAHLVNVKMEQHDNSIFYKINDKDEGKLIIELEFDAPSNNLLMMRQAVTKKVEISEKLYQTVVEMNYSYPAQQQRPEVSQYVYERNGDWKCAPSYTSYELLAN